jgi:hypothetical protein
MMMLKVALAVCLLAAVASASPHYVQGTLDFPSIPAVNILTGAVSFYDLTLTNTDGSSVPQGVPVMCGATGDMLSATWFHAWMSATNEVTVRMFNGGTSAANPPSMDYSCTMDWFYQE